MEITENSSNMTVKKSLEMEFITNLWRKCRKILLKQITTLANSSDFDEKKQCIGVFDGWSCWNTTPAGVTAYVPCPNFITGFDYTRTAFRTCMDNGTWFTHPETGQPWSNYTTCVDLPDLRFREIVNTIYIAGYTLSSAALVLSLIIFLSFRSLRCTRIAIHVHLFSSFALNNLMWIIWYNLVVGNTQTVHENSLMCRGLHILLQYLMLANYFWMFCEGLHLHLALVVVFVRDNSAMRWFYFIGWFLPVVITAIYTSIRAHVPEDTRQCWMNESHAQWALTLPVCLSMLASLAFLINVMRVLLTKLHCNSANPAPIGLRKALRAALILVPLFGIHLILIPFRPEPHEPGEKVYQVFSALLVSLQGFCVSVLFCFANVDVHSAINSFINARKRRRLRKSADGDLNMTTGATQTRCGLDDDTRKILKPIRVRQDSLAVKQIQVRSNHDDENRRSLRTAIFNRENQV